MKIEAGKTYECEYPFIKVDVPDYAKLREQEWTEPDPPTVKSWRPGTEIVRDGYYPDYQAWADALGHRIFVVISMHKPGKYPERVFYLQKWRDPDGNVFGKNCLRITTTGNFRRLLMGHRWGFEIEEKQHHGSECKYGEFY